MTGSGPEIVVRPGTGDLSIDGLDAAWSAARVSTSTPADAPLFINLDRVTFLHIEAMMMLLALLVDRTRRRFSTRLELPRKEGPLNALRAWDFARVTKESTGVDLDVFLTVGSRLRFQNREPIDSPFVSIIETPDGGVQMELPGSFFALKKVEMGQDAEVAAEVARLPYYDRHLVEILNDALKQDGRRIGSFLVREAIKNCVSHPQANVAYTTMQIRKNEVAIVVWDDGDSFSATFAQAHAKKAPLKSLAYGRAADVINTKFIDRDMTSKSKDIDHNSKTDDPHDDEEFIPFAFIMGTSSTPDIIYRRTDDERKDLEQYVPHDLIPYSGIGLHVIRKCVVDVFGGSIFYAAGGYRFDLRAKAKDEPGVYKGMLTLRRQGRSQVAGNLLVFRLPIPPKQTRKVTA
jgi:hypothetical protein